MKKLTYWMFCLLLLTGGTFLTSCGDDVVDDMEEMMEEEENQEPANDTTVTANNMQFGLPELLGGQPWSVGADFNQIDASTNFGTLTYEIVSQSPNGAISIAADGKILVQSQDAFDFEINDRIDARVKVSAGTHSKEINLLVDIINVTEFVRFPSGGVNMIPTYVENITLNTAPLSQFTAETDGEITYELGDNDFFVIDPNTGVVTAKPNVSFDYEEVVAANGSNEVSFVVRAVAVDVQGLYAQTDFKVRVSDVMGSNEAAERLGQGQTPAQVYAADPTLADSLIGLNYQGGKIATFNSSTGRGVSISIAGDGTERNWSQANSFANNLVQNGYSDWRLMTKAEADQACDFSTVLSEGNYNGFWLKDNCGGICYEWVNFSSNNACGGGGSPGVGGNAQTWSHVRAVRQYN